MRGVKIRPLGGWKFDNEFPPIQQNRVKIRPLGGWKLSTSVKFSNLLTNCLVKIRPLGGWKYSKYTNINLIWVLKSDLLEVKT